MTLQSNHIPTMTHELGRYWSQPSPNDIIVGDKTALMKLETLHKLSDYSASYPSGVYPGKMWRRESPEGWKLCWYEVKSDTLCCIKTRVIKIVDNLPVPQVTEELPLVEDASTPDSELETLRMQLAACGVISLCNTPESLKQQGIGPENPYYSDSYKQVESGVQREILLMQEVERLTDLIVQLSAQLDHGSRALQAIRKVVNPTSTGADLQIEQVDARRKAKEKL